MDNQPAFRPHPDPGVPPGWRGEPPFRTPSGRVPSGPLRPTYREPHPVRPGALAAGAAAAAAWLMFFGFLGHDLPSYVWWTVFAGGVAWLVALLLTRVGDRGVAAGVAMVTAAGWTIAVTAVAVRWAMSGTWPLW